MNAQAQFELLKSIRQEIRENPVLSGYGASRWDDNSICVSYSVWGVQDSTQRFFVDDQEEWEALKPTLGRHSADMLSLLKEYGECVGGDLSRWLVYGSPLRPVAHVWARIDGAVYMQVDKAQTGYHTYIAVPVTLSRELIEKYGLVFISR